MHWTIEKTLDLIQLYKERTLLWNPKSLRYREKNERRKAYEEISTALQVQVEECERKIHSLRTQFQREYKRKGRKSAWFAYEQLKFLLSGPKAGKMIEASYDKEDEESDNESKITDLKIERIVAVRNEAFNETVSAAQNTCSESIEIQEDDNQVIVYQNSTHDDIPSSDNTTILTSTLPKKQCIEYISNNENTMTMEVRQTSSDIGALIRSPPQQQQQPLQLWGADSFDLFGKYIAEELRSVRDDVYTTQVAKHRINQILFEATTGALRRPNS